MAILLGIDFETTGLNPAVDKIIEVAAMIWDTDFNEPVDSFSSLVHYDHEVIIPDEITKLTGISQLMYENHSCDAIYVFHKLAGMGYNVDYWVAHNAPFEQKFLDRFIQDVKWIDTKTDIPGHAGKRLTYMAADHGFVNPFPHRALSDVMTMFKVLSQYDFAEIERYALAPAITWVANVSYDDRQKAKDCGYYWHGETKQWRKDFKDFQAEEEFEKAKAAGFQAYPLAVGV